MAKKNPCFSVKEFKELTREELYEILALRVAVFVVEQECAYPEVDFKDQKAFHIEGRIHGKIMAYARCFAPGDYFEEAALGRVLIEEKYRKAGYAHRLLDFILHFMTQTFGSIPIKVSAQEHLRDFYNQHGFSKEGEGYWEDGIPHIAMIRK